MNIAIIPSKLQPLDVAINKNFKAKNDIIIGCLLPFMLLLQLEEDLIRRSFKCCGVSTNTDGSEDNDLFDYDKLLGMLEDNDEVDINNPDDEENEYTKENDYENRNR
ncbi:uncharacterized protein OCT59_016719 [Rhizophagus irregularis]|uniref:Uncharacterized protein n=1 Tax=Rhizophagus irregularis (strain DAOM 181602 / DAOM 197198 / MUCL 43194) TaxID=747089 RepID=U9UE89_RHIID|nr:hypothetical protein OCT59_016719 [Rhizophagus irregularis]